MALIDLPEIDFVDEEVTGTLNQMVTVVEGILGRTLYPGDPLRLFLQSQALLLVQQRALINLTAKANYLRYAPGDVLDHMGAFTRTPRIPAAPARVTLRFTLSTAQASAVSIPLGTRASSAGGPAVYYATTAYAEVPPGSLFVDADAACMEAGAVGNGFLPGQINVLVDPIAFVASVANTTTSEGGADLEADDAYRNRIHEAPESFSVAGPAGAYKYWAKTASAAIIDVSVTSPAPMEVRIVPLLAGGEIPGQEVLDAVDETCSSVTIRPLTDFVTVAAPSVVAYDVDLTYWIHIDKAAEATAIQANVDHAVSNYLLWQRSKLGRDINPSELIGRMMAAGAYRANVISPAYAVVDVNSVAIAGEVTVTFGGLVDD